MMRSANLVARRAVLTASIIAALVGVLALANEEVTLIGEIEVAEYDDDGNALSVMIYDSEWGSVLVADEGRGKELLDYVGTRASVTGMIIELDDDSGYSYAIQVSAYTIDEMEEPGRD